jgi:ATP-dependent DNA helicase RecG
MFNANEIKNLIISGEGYNLEFKRSIPSKVRELSEEVCAFANAAGGIVIIGVDDSNNIVGISIDNFKRSAIQNSLNEISPSLDCDFYEVTIDDKKVVVLEVPSGKDKPYVLSGAIYIRIGPNTQKLTTIEKIRSFF